MQNQTTVVARVQDGSPALSSHQRDQLARFYKSREGKFVQITVREQGRPRSTNQNKYYHAIVVGMIADETGHDPEEIHEILKAKFLPRQFTVFNGEEVELDKSTTRLSTQEFEEFLDRIRAFAAQELCLLIPLPHESL
jgi:hypothetical protein